MKTKQLFRKQLYNATKKLNLTKRSNDTCLWITALIVICLLFGDFPKDLLTSSWKIILTIFYSITLFLLIISHFFWKRYSESKIAGLFETIAVYGDTPIVIYVGGWALGVSTKVIVFVTILALFYYFITLFVALQYEKKGDKERPIAKWLVLGPMVILIFSIALGVVTQKEIFMNIGLAMLGFIATFRIVPYIFIINFPYKLKLREEFGPKDIEASSIFINKKKNEEK